MKLYTVGEKKSALCHRDGRVMTTFAYKDVPFKDSKGIAKNILVGVCDVCCDVILIPAQSTPSISDARKKAQHSLEVKLPAFYMDTLDAAISRLAPSAGLEFRKQLLVYYLNLYASGEEDPKELIDLSIRFAELFAETLDTSSFPTKRLSMKLNDITDIRMENISNKAKLSKTELVKSIVAKIYDDIVRPEKPKHQEHFSKIADGIYA